MMPGYSFSSSLIYFMLKERLFHGHFCIFHLDSLFLATYGMDSYVFNANRQALNCNSMKIFHFFFFLINPVYVVYEKYNILVNF